MSASLNPSSNHGRKLELLIAFHRKSLAVREREGFLELAGREVKEILAAERATVFLIDFDSKELYGQFALGLGPQELKALRLPVGQGIAGHVAKNGVMLNVTDAYKSPYFNPEFDRMTHFKTRSVLAAPLKDFSGRTMGVLAAFNKAQGVFDKEDEHTLELLAHQVAATLEIVDLLETLKLTGLESIYALAQTAEFRDQEDTAPHINRVSSYAAMLAEAIGLLPPVVEIIRVTSPLHDIGKVAIRDEILKKPGKFTPQEFDEMKKHTLYGYEMLKNFKSPLLKAAAKVALAHHERFDGKGYPHGIKGTDIPLEARIVTLVDSFDAMTSKRVYKPAFTFDDASAEMKRCSGSQFDPMLVDAFFKNQERFREFLEKSRKEPA